MPNREQLIRQRAYELWELRESLGLTDFTAEMNWLDAEYDVDHGLYPRENLHSVNYHALFDIRA